MVRVLAVNSSAPESGVLDIAASALRSGALVAFPTETVYGLGARGLVEDAVAKIFAAKGRPPTHPLILHVDGEAMAREVAYWSQSASDVARAFWPGPLTLVLPRRACVPGIVTAGLDSVAVRFPEHPVAVGIIARVGEPVAAPSANAHTRVSPTEARHVLESLGDRVDLIVDGGPCWHGIESTVVDLTGEPRVLRAGALSWSELRRVLPNLRAPGYSVAEGVARSSPGLSTVHYAPSARLVLVDARSLAEALVRETTAAQRVGIVVWSEEGREAAGGPSACELALVRTLGPGPVEYARALFSALYDCDRAACTVVLVEEPPKEDAWAAVNDRLRRASAHSPAPFV